MKKSLFTFFVLTAVSFGQFVNAQITGDSGSVSTTIHNPLGNLTSIPLFVANALSFVARIGGVLSIFFLIYAGFMYVKARGNPGEITKAHDILKSTIYGIILLLGAQLISSIIIGTINALRQ